MLSTEDRREIRKITGQHQSYVCDKGPVSYSPPRSHWRMSKDRQKTFLRRKYVRKTA